MYDMCVGAEHVLKQEGKRIMYMISYRGGDTWRGTTLRGGYLREQNELTPDSYEKI